MIIVKGAIPVIPNRRQEALEIISRLACDARAESGCLDYDVCIRLEQPNTVVLFQQWRSIEALEEHFASDHVEAFIDVIPDLIEGDVESIRFDVLSEQGAEEQEIAEPAQVCEATILH